MGGGGCEAKEAALENSWSNGNIVNNLLPPTVLLSQTVSLYFSIGGKTLHDFCSCFSTNLQSEQVNANMRILGSNS